MRRLLPPDLFEGIDGPSAEPLLREEEPAEDKPVQRKTGPLDRNQSEFNFEDQELNALASTFAEGAD